MPVKLAIIGCGAIAEIGHLPGAMRTRDVDVTVLVDRDEARARRLAEAFGIANVETEIARAADHAEAACVCLPPHLHRKSAETLLEAGLHILMEKPLATNVEDSEAILAAAKRTDRVLAVAMMRRFARSARYLKALVDSGMLGPLRHYVASSGAAEAWPSRSPFTFSVEQSGGGALISNGCHDIDLMLWLMGPIADFDYFTDSMKRMEGNCILACRMKNGTKATLEISRTRTLSNTIRIEGEYGSALAPLMGEAVTVIPHGCAPEDLSPREAPALDYAGVMADQLSDFAAAFRGEHPPLIGGDAGRDMVALVERCYAHAQRMQLPWDLPIDVPGAA